MGIVVKRGDFLYIGTNGISAITVRANANFRPASWWSRVVQAILKPLTGSDPFNLTAEVVSATDRSRTTSITQIDFDGEIDSGFISIIGGTAPAGPGEVWADMQILRPGTNSSIGVIARGYLHEGASPSYPTPNGSPLSSVDGVGRIREITTADPAAGSEVINQTVPTNAKWLLRTFSVQLVQGITQTPLPALQIRGGISATTWALVPITQTAIAVSTTSRLTWAIGLVQQSFTAVIANEIHTAPLPVIILPVSSDIATLTDGIGANTNYGAALMQVEEWIDP